MPILSHYESSSYEVSRIGLIGAIDHHPLQLQLFRTIVASEDFTNLFDDWRQSWRQMRSCDGKDCSLPWKS